MHLDTTYVPNVMGTLVESESVIGSGLDSRPGHVEHGFCKIHWLQKRSFSPPYWFLCPSLRANTGDWFRLS